MIDAEFKFFEVSILIEGSRESAPTNNRKFTSDKRKQAQGKWACGRAFAGARLRARICGRAFAGERSACIQAYNKRCMHDNVSQLNSFIIQAKGKALFKA